MLFHDKLLSGSFRPMGDNWPDLRIHFVDSSGFTYPHVTLGGSFSTDFQKCETWAKISSAAFPRRERELNVQIVDRSDALVMEFRLPNPAFQKSVSEWKATPLPVTATRDKFKLHLRGFDIDPQSGNFIPQLEIEPNRSGWKAEMYAAELEDATGNYGYRLSPWEPCWKLPVTLECTADPDSPAREQLKLGPVPLPAKGQSRVIGDPRTWSTTSTAGQDDARDLSPITRTIGRTSVTIGPPQNWRGNPNVMNYQGPEDANCEALIEIDTSHLPPTVCILTAVHDQTGNELTAALPECAPEASPQKFALPFKAGDDVTSLSISLMISDQYQIDFFIVPPHELREKSLQSKFAGRAVTDSSAGTLSETSPSPP